MEKIFPVNNSKAARRREREEFVYIYRETIAKFLVGVTGYHVGKEAIVWADRFVRPALKYSPKTASCDIFWSMRVTYNRIKHLFV